jgi:hypothetical protein
MASKKSRWESAVGIISAVAAVIAIPLAIVAIVVGSTVAHDIDDDAQRRSEHDLCGDAVQALRVDLIALRRGYAIDRADKVTRLSDWDDVRFALDSVSLACAGSLKGSVAEGFIDLRATASDELDSAFTGLWDEQNTLDLIEWTSDAMRYLLSA